MSTNSRASAPRGAGIFISYRRQDGEGYVLTLSERLKAEFGHDKVFLDIDQEHLKSGDDFAQVIERRVRSSGVLLAVIGAGWLSLLREREKAFEAEGETDFVRAEVAAALVHEIPVVPVLLNDAAMPARKDLPDDLKRLAQLQAFRLRSESWDTDVRRLVARLKEILPRRRRLPLVVGLCAVLALPSLAAVYYFAGRGPTNTNTNANGANVNAPAHALIEKVRAVPTEFTPYKVALSPNGDTAALAGALGTVGTPKVAGTPGEVRLFLTASGERLPSLSGLGGHGRSVAFNPADGQVVAAGSDDHVIRFWRLGESKAFCALHDKDGYVYFLEFGADGQTVTTADNEVKNTVKKVDYKDTVKRVKVWRRCDDRPMTLATLTGANFPPAVSPTARLAVFSTVNGVNLQPLDGGAARTLPTGRVEVTDNAFSNDGKTLALGVRDGLNTYVQLWDATDARQIRNLPLRNDRVAGVLALSPDGRLLIIGFEDGKLEAYDPGTGETALFPDAHAGEILNISFSADGKTLASVGKDNQLIIWRVTQ